MKNSFQSKEKYQKKAEKQYELWKNNWEEYSNNVEEIIKIFNLKGESKFQTKEAPKYWAGDIDSNPKFFIISLNPGYPKGNEKKFAEGIRQDARSWNKYKKNRKNWFTDRSSNISESKYWEKNYRLICGMNNELPEKDIDGEYILENVLNLNLFPYHSHKSEDFPSKFNVRQLEIILHHLVLLFDLIEEKKPRYCFFNGKVWETLLIKHKLTGVKFSDPDPFKTNSKGTPFSMYYGKKGRTRYVLFDKFLSSTRYYGVTKEDISEGIPRSIINNLEF